MKNFFIGLLLGWLIALGIAKAINEEIEYQRRMNIARAGLQGWIKGIRYALGKTDD